MKKKTLITALCMVLVCVLSVAGTLAFLKESTVKVENTFVADGGGKLAEAFTIEEQDVEQQEDGSYILKDDEGEPVLADGGVAYLIAPGRVLPKKAWFNIEGKTTVPAYVYLEVVDTLEEGFYTYAVDSDNWEPLMDGAETPAQVVGPNGGLLYTLKSGMVSAEDEDLDPIGILDDDIVTVSDALEESDFEGLSDQALDFYGYLAQASAGDDALGAFNACFGD